MNPDWMQDGDFTFSWEFLTGGTYQDPRGPGSHYNGPNLGHPIFDYSDEDEESRQYTPDGDPLLDAGFAAGYEVISLSERELREMPEDEWILLQRLISEPVSYPNTQISCSNVAAGNVVLTILHHVPCITSLER